MLKGCFPLTSQTPHHGNPLAESTYNEVIGVELHVPHGLSLGEDVWTWCAVVLVDHGDGDGDGGSISLGSLLCTFGVIDVHMIQEPTVGHIYTPKPHCGYFSQPSQWPSKPLPSLPTHSMMECVICTDRLLFGGLASSCCQKSHIIARILVGKGRFLTNFKLPTFSTSAKNALIIYL